MGKLLIKYPPEVDVAQLQKILKAHWKGKLFFILPSLHTVCPKSSPPPQAVILSINGNRPISFGKSFLKYQNFQPLLRKLGSLGVSQDFAITAPY